MPPPVQSALVTHPWLAFVPPTQLPVWHAPDAVQSPSEQQTVLAGSGAAHLPKSLEQTPPPVQAAGFPLTLQAPPVVQSPPAFVPPTHRLGIRSPVRKSLDESGRLSPPLFCSTRPEPSSPLSVPLMVIGMPSSAPPPSSPATRRTSRSSMR